MEDDDIPDFEEESGFDYFCFGATLLWLMGFVLLLAAWSKAAGW